MPATLVAHGINKTFRARGRLFRRSSASVAAVQDASLSIGRGRTLGLIGESGSGKSTLARCLACLERPDSGRVWLQGDDLLALNASELRRVRRRIQIIFQGSAATLNPRLNALELVSEPLAITGELNRQQRHERARSLMERVGLPAALAQRKPLELSGGQRQRLAIARALTLEPSVLILDESLTGLDLPVQAHLVNLLIDLQESHGISYLFISHDLRLAAHIADELAVMQGGRIVEQGPVQQVIEAPRHTHTRELLAAASILRLERLG